MTRGAAQWAKLAILAKGQNFVSDVSNMRENEKREGLRSITTLALPAA